MGLLKDIFSFSKGLVAEPELRFRELADGKTRAAVPAAIYLLALLLGALFMKIRPGDFPAEYAQLSLPDKSFFFYFSTGLFWDTLFGAASSALLLFFLGFFGKGRLSLRILLCAAAVTLPYGAAFYAGDATLFRAVTAATALFIAGVIRAEKAAWPRFFLASLTLNLAAVLAFPAVLAAVLLRSENLFIASQAAAGLWSLLLLIKMARAFTGAAIPGAALALVAAFASSLLLFASLYAGGLVSRQTFALMFAL